MAKFRTAESRAQLTLFPRSIEDLVPEEDMVRYVDALVDEFDLSSVVEQYSCLGRPAYDPIILTKILVYGKLRGIGSARELATACKENIRFIYLAQNEKPDFRTINIFRRKFIGPLGGLLKQTVKIGLEQGVITLEDVSIDGTKIRANASKKSVKNPKNLEKLLNRLEKSLEKDIELDKKEDKEHGDDDGEPKLPTSLHGRKALRDKVREALKQLEEEQKKGSKKERSTSDPDARFMKGPEGKQVSYNGQAAVDSASMMVVGGYASNCGCDQGQLKPMLEEIEETTGRNPQCVCADKGYRKTEGLEELDKRGILGVVALQEADKSRYSLDDFLYDEENDEYICPDGRVLEHHREREGCSEYRCEDCRGCKRVKLCLKQKSATRGIRIPDNVVLVEQMRQRLRTEFGAAKLKLRAQTVELSFAWLKIHRKFRQFVFRGMNLVDNEWKFMLAILNISRLINLRRQKA